MSRTFSGVIFAGEQQTSAAQDCSPWTGGGGENFGNGIFRRSLYHAQILALGPKTN